ncbi:hypothetical protein C8R44DRAFT_821395 [Mycena epipterygia]|nr:hypothetical protein C8R44DRAFT_821395 [Mycena epipterygia]
MIFLDIPEDVIQYSLCLSDIYSVISISQTNKYLHELALTPTIWIALVDDLRHRGFVDRLSAADIRAMSTQSLVTVVKRLVVGPEAWSPPSRIQSRSKSFSRILQKLSNPRGRRAVDSPPVQACTHIVLHPSIHPTESVYRSKFTVLKGGKYVLFCDRDAQGVPVLGCWRVADDSFVGIYRSALPFHNIRDFEAEVRDGGEHANIVLTLYPGFVEVISWDFATAVIQLLSKIECTGDHFDTLFSPKICFGVAAALLFGDGDEEMYAIIDWRAQQYCLIVCPRSDCQMELIPGYFILSWTAGRTQEIEVFSMTSLSCLWTPVVQHNMADPVLLSNLPHIASHTVKVKGKIVRHDVIFAVHKSPLQRGTYRVWIYIRYSEPRVLGGSTTRALMYRFRLSLPGTSDRQFTWQQQSCTTVPTNVRSYRISYSGHTTGEIWATEPPNHLIFPPEYSAPIILQIPETPWSAQPVPYSGAVGYATEQTFVLSYFE